MGKNTNIDALVTTAANAWEQADAGAESARVMAVRPLVSVDNADTRKRFAAAIGQKSTSTVGRYFQASGLTVKHRMTVAEAKAHGGNIVRALKVKGGPDALAKVGTKADLIEAARGIAERGKAEKSAQAKQTRKSSTKGKQNTRQTVAQQAHALSVRLQTVRAGGKDAEALTSADMEALSLLVKAVVSVQTVPAKVPNVGTGSRGRVRKVA